MAIKCLFLVLAAATAACGASPTVPAVNGADVASMETRVAVYAQGATLAAADASGAQATYQAVVAVATRQVSDALTATAAVQQSTMDAIFATSQAVAAAVTQAAINAVSTRAALEAQAQATSAAAAYAGTATVQAAAAAGTAAAINQLVVVERNAANMQATRAALEVDRLENEIQRGRIMPWLLAAGVAVAGGALFFLVWRRGNPITVIDSPADYRPQVVVARDGYTVYPALPYANGGGRGPALLPASVPARDENGANAPNDLPPIVELPAVSRAGDGLMVGVSPNRALTVPYHEFMDVLGAGTKGSGKSTMVRMLAYQSRLMGWDTRLADAEGLTFSPTIWGDVALEPEAFAQTIEAVLDEFSHRSALFAQAFAQVRELPAEQQDYIESLAQYNAFAPRLGLAQLPVMALWVDEANQFIGRSGQADRQLEKLLQLNRKNGCVVGLFGHSWHTDSVPSYLYRRFTYRLALTCDERTSRVVIGSPAAASLPLRSGLAIVRQVGRPPFKIKSYYLSPQRVLRDIQPVSRGEWLPAMPPQSVPTMTDGELRAMMDAETIRGAGIQPNSRRQVCLHSLGIQDNGDGYTRVDAALAVLASDGNEWARALLEDAGVVVPA